MLLAILSIIIISKYFKNLSLSDWGFNLKESGWTLNAVFKFAVGWLIISVLLNLLFTFKSQINYSRDILHITTDLIFDFIVTPFSEEILFRGLIMTLLIYFCPGKIKISKLNISYAVLFSTLFFSLAHVGINFQTLTIDYFNTMQLLFTIGLGLFYAMMRERTGSLLGPFLAHGISDGSISVIQLVLLN